MLLVAHIGVCLKNFECSTWNICGIYAGGQMLRMSQCLVRNNRLDEGAYIMPSLKKPSAILLHPFGKCKGSDVFEARLF